MKVALAQVNPIVGDFEGNAGKINESAARAKALGADIAVFPEMSIMGYPPRDLVEQKGFVDGGLSALQELAKSVPLPCLVGFVSRNETGQGKPLHNSAALLRDGRIDSVHHKSLLPTYDVFDEDRYFEPGASPQAIDLAVGLGGSVRAGVTICEDLWREQTGPLERYRLDPIPVLTQLGVQVILNLSASPFTLGKMEIRRRMLSHHARRLRLPVIYVNQVGGNDELVFDGGSMVFNAQGELVLALKSFEEDLGVVDLGALPEPVQCPPENKPEAALNALVLGTRDYLHKCGFRSAVIGLSGGIDSALTAVIAAAALGKENVLGVSLPSRFSSPGSKDDARILAENLGIKYAVIPIHNAHQCLLDTLEPVFRGLPQDATEENLQSRIRGTLLMALSNKFGGLLLTTGNKSELATGYCTLYGDMNGGLAPISDVPKMMVYEIARWVNRERAIIPVDSITKAPSAELRPNQTDQDTLPPYDQLDRVLREYVEEQKDPQEIIAGGIDAAIVRDVIRRIECSEYKRRQAVPGLKITSKAFGYGRRVPIAKKTPV